MAIARVSSFVYMYNCTCMCVCVLKTNVPRVRETSLTITACVHNRRKMQTYKSYCLFFFSDIVVVDVVHSCRCMALFCMSFNVMLLLTLNIVNR